MKVIILSAQHKGRVSKSSILRVYAELLNTKCDVGYYCVSNNIYHRLKGRDKRLLRGENKAIFTWSFWYYPGLIRVLDTFLSKFWAKKHVSNVINTMSEANDVHLIVEAGSASVVARFLVEKIRNMNINLSVHYRINDPLDAFRSTSPAVQSAQNFLFELNIPNVVFDCSAPCKVGSAAHIPPGIPDILYSGSREVRQSNNYLLYSGVYPIEASMLSELNMHYTDMIIKYTGELDHKIQGTEFLGIIPAEDIDRLWLGASGGIMVFPDERFDWWVWSNKMMVMRFLNLPIFGFLKNSSSDVFKSFRDKSEWFVDHGLVELGSSQRPKRLKRDYIRNWQNFAMCMLRPEL